MAFSYFEQHGQKWCNGKLIMVPVWFTGSQLPPTVMKRSHKFKVAKKDVYLSNENLAIQLMIKKTTEPKRKKKQKF